MLDHGSTNLAGDTDPCGTSQRYLVLIFVWKEISYATRATHEPMLLAAKHVSTDDVAVVIDTKGTSQRRSWEIDRFELPLRGSHEPVKGVCAFAPHADDITLRVHAPG